MLSYAFESFLTSIVNNQCKTIAVPGVGNPITPPLKFTHKWTNDSVNKIYAVAVLPNGNIVSGSHDNLLRVWEPETGECIATWEGHRKPITALAVLPDGNIISGSEDKSLRIWNAQTGECLTTLMQHKKSVQCLAVLSDGTVVSGSLDNTLRHWDLKENQCIAVWEGHTKGVAAVAELPDGTVVSGSWDNMLRHWDPKSDHCLRKWAGHSRWVSAVVALPDGTVVSGSYDNTLRHWKLEDNSEKTTCLATWKGHRDNITALAVLSDGTVVSTSADKTLRYWDPQNKGSCLYVWRGHKQAVKAIAECPDGTVVSGSEDSTLLHWPQVGSTLLVNQLDQLLDKLTVNNSVTTLTIANAQFSEKTLSLLINAIKCHPTLASLTVKNCGLTNETAKPLLQVLQAWECKIVNLTLEIEETVLCGNTRQSVVTALREYLHHQPRQDESNKESALSAVSQQQGILAALVEGYRDKLSEEHLMAEPILAAGDGRTYERETLLNYLGYTVIVTHCDSEEALKDTLTKVNQAENRVPLQWHLLYDQKAKSWYVSALDVSGERVQGPLKNHDALKGLEQHSLLQRCAEVSLSTSLVLGAGNENQDKIKSTFYQGPMVNEVTNILARALGYQRWSMYPTHHNESPYTRQSLEGSVIVENQGIKEQIGAYLESEPSLWHDSQEGVTLPEGWQWGVLKAIKTGDFNALDRYWNRHPGLVTRAYDHREGERLDRVFIESGRLEDFQRWLERYNDYYMRYTCVPSLKTVLSCAEGSKGHAVHALITHERGEEWNKILQSYGEWPGDYYHSLVHLHQSHTEEQDAKAIERLLARKILPEHQDEAGRTPFMVSIAQGKYNLAYLLMPHSRLGEHDKNGDTALHYLASQEHSDERDNFIVKLLCEDIDSKVTNNDNKTVEELLEKNEPGYYQQLMEKVRRHQAKQIQELSEKVKKLSEENARLRCKKRQDDPQLTTGVDNEDTQEKRYCSPSFF
ncbi:MAG: ankyrin repeat domain-containing protein [Gammaproteobacteria bacterium]